MGQNHLRVYDHLKNAELIGFYEPDLDKCNVIEEKFGCKSFDSLEALADAVDAVSICVPSSFHIETGKVFLARGIHCLIEKPLATSREDCLELIDCAQSNNAKLLVGHIERFNPAVQQIFNLLTEGAKIQAIDARRLSAVSARIKDVDVVTDLMVHDLDIVTALADSPIKLLYAGAVRTEKSNGKDHVSVLLQFDSGILATVTASRISQNMVRRLSVTTDHGVVEVDYVNQSADVYLGHEIIRRDQSKRPFGEYSCGISLESVQIRRQEPLQLELAHFIDIIENDGEPLVSGEQGLAAMEVVWSIQDILEQKS